MSYRDDFSSNMSSPGNYSSSSTYGSPGYSGNYGGSNNPGFGYQTPAQANFVAAGGSFGPGAGFGNPIANHNNGLGSQSSLLGQVTSGPIPPALGPQGIPTPSAMPPSTMPASSLPAYLRYASQYANPFRWPTQARAGIRAGQPGTAPQGSYTRPPGASFGMGMAGYGGMGNDFRSTNFSPSSYPGGDGITGNDIGGGGWR